mgnify:CR=1 FL=1
MNAYNETIMRSAIDLYKRPNFISNPFLFDSRDKEILTGEASTQLMRVARSFSLPMFNVFIERSDVQIDKIRVMAMQSDPSVSNLALMLYGSLIEIECKGKVTHELVFLGADCKRQILDCGAQKLSSLIAKERIRFSPVLPLEVYVRLGIENSSDLLDSYLHRRYRILRQVSP